MEKWAEIVVVSPLPSPPHASTRERWLAEYLCGPLWLPPEKYRLKFAYSELRNVAEALFE